MNPVFTLDPQLTDSEKVFLLEGLKAAADGAKDHDENVYEVLTRIREKLIIILK